MHPVEQHQALLQQLMRPSAFPHAVEALDLRQTHISSLILTGNYVYKLKKPVDLGFLNFSTLALRKHFCEEEIRLNRRLSPEIYLGISTITRTDDSVEFDGDGEIVDYAVRMRQFNADQTLDKWFRAYGTDAIDMTALAGTLACFHQRAAVAEPGSEFATPEAVRAPMLQNFTALQSLLPQPRPAQLATLEQWTLTQLEAQQPALAERLNGGAIRECHGDLHLGNIAIDRGQALIFDGIEFSPALRWIDVISDLAFLVMDLQMNGYQPQATVLLNHYLEITGDYAGAALLPLYMVYRAMVRAKVAAISASQLHGQQQQQKLDDMQRYLDSASRLSRPGNGRLLLMRGVSGSGKTWLSGQLLTKMPMIRIRSDLERQRSGLTADYSASGRRAVYQRIAGSITGLLRAGHTVLVDATFLRLEDLQDFLGLARDLGAASLVLEAYARQSTLEQRIQQRQQQGQDASEADRKVLQAQLQSYEPLDDNIPTLTLDTESLPPWPAIVSRIDALTV